MSKILFPVGRMIGGSLYKPRPRTDNLGKPKLDAAGAPMTGFDFGVAIKKGAEASWQLTTWGAEIKKIGETAFGAQSLAPTFAWKITDGDSVIPNKKGRIPRDQDGYAGHWVLWFSQSWAPDLCNADGTQKLTEPDSIMPGYFVQVYADVKDNGSKNPSPGVYLNPIAVALSGYGERIESSGVDTTSVGFGASGAVPGMSAVPVAAMVAPPPAAAAAAPVAMPPAPPITPNPAILAPPPGPMLTPAGVAAGGTYDNFKAAGWNDEQLRAQGYLA